MIRLSKRVLALILTVIMVFSNAPMTGFAAEMRYKDLSGHWASAAIERWSDHGVLSGYDGRFRPDDPITRAEMAAVLQRVIGYVATDENPFSDVSVDKWYFRDVLSLAAAGVMIGDNGKAQPENNITREETAVLLSRAFDLEQCNVDPRPFSDSAEIAPWAADFVGGLHAAGYIKGKPGNVFDPKANITRAEAVTILDNMVGGFYNKPDEYGGKVAGNAVVRTDGVILKDIQISHALYLMEGIGVGSATLDHVFVAEKTYIRGGSSNSISVTGGNLGEIEMNSLTNTHLALSADTEVTKLIILNSGTVTRDGITVTFDAIKGTLTLGGKIDQAVLNADGSITVNAGGVKYEIIMPAGKFTSLALSPGSVLKELSLNAPLQITGTGQIDRINAHAEGCIIDGSINAMLENIIVDRGIAVTIAGRAYTGKGGSLASGHTDSPSNDGDSDDDSDYGDSDDNSGYGGTVKVYYETFGEPQIAPSIVAKGSKLTGVPQPSRSDSVFTGWYTDAAFTEVFDADRPITGNMTLYADWIQRQNNYQEYSESDKFIDECSPRHAIAIVSPDTPVTAATLEDYVLIEGTGRIPQFNVNDLGSGCYVIEPRTDYEAGCLYTFSLKYAGLTFKDEDGALRSITIRPPKEETKIIDFNDSIFDVDWDDVSYYTTDEETGTGSMEIPALKYSGVRDAFRLNSVNPETRTTIRIKDFIYDSQDENYQETQYRNITDLTEADGVLMLQTENSQLIDVFESLEVFLPNLEINLDEYMAGLDMNALETQAAQSTGARKMGELLNTALAVSPTIQGMASESADIFGTNLPTSADYGFKTPSRENEKPLLPSMFDMVLQLKNVKATTGETDNANMPYGSGYFVTVEFNYSGKIKNKVEVEATFKVTQYMSIFAGLNAKYQGVWNRPNTWDDLEVTFLTNIYSQTDITVGVFAKSISKDPEYAYEIDVTEELTKLMNGDEESGEGASAMLKKVLADQGDYIDLISLPIVKTSIEIIPEAPVVEVEFELDFVIKASFAAGIHADMTFLGARALGFYYNLDNGEKRNYNLPFERYDNQYYIDLWAVGYFGVKAGVKGEVTVGIIGMKDIFDAGMSMEFGVYADMYGLVHLQHYKHIYPNHKGTNIQGGLYFEVGIYLEMAIFVRSKAFSAIAEWKFLDKKWPLYTFGDQYLLVKFANSGSYILMREDLPLTGGAGLFDAEFIDLKTGEIVKGGEYANSQNFSVVISSPYFEVDKTKKVIKVLTDKIGDSTVYPYYSPGTKTLSASAIIYYDGSALAFGTHTVVPYGSEDMMYSQKGITLVWADPSLYIGDMSDLKSYKATYYLEMDGNKTLLDQREVLVGQVPGAPVLPLSGNFKYFSWMEILEYDHNCVVTGASPDFYSAIKEDTEYVITAEKLQRLEALITHYNDRWHFDVYAVNCGELPTLPAGYDTPFGGWSEPVNWYVETGYPAITVTALDKLQTVGGKYTVGQMEDGRGVVSYNPRLPYVSGYPTDTPIYSYESPKEEDYSIDGLFNDYTAYAYVHKWKRPAKDFAPAREILGPWWIDTYDSKVSNPDGNFNEDVNWTRFYEYLYLAEHAKKTCTVTFDAGDGEFAQYMVEYLDDYSRYFGVYLMGTTMNVLPASTVVAPEDPVDTYVLTGWKDRDGNIYGLNDSFTAMEDMYFTAVYESIPNVYTITVYPAGATFPDGYKEKTFSGGYNEDTNIDLDFNMFDDWRIPAYEGYEYVFDGWYIKADGDRLTDWPLTFGELGEGAQDIVIVAKIKRVIKQQQHTVTFNANGGQFSGGENLYTKDYAHDAIIDPVEIPVPTRASDNWYNYTFAGWTFYGPLEPVTQDATYYAVWNIELKDAPLPEGIFISDGEKTEDINCVNLGEEYIPIEGYKYELKEYEHNDPETGQSTFWIPTLTVTGNNLTVSGSVYGGVNDIKDMVALVIDDEVTDITFKNLSLTSLFEYEDLVSAVGEESLDITISGVCHLQKYSNENVGYHRSAFCSERDVLFLGSDENASLKITTESAHGFSAYEDIKFHNLKLIMDVSGVIEEYDNYDGTREFSMAMAFGGEGGAVMYFIDSDVEVESPGSWIVGSIIIEGSGDFEYLSTDDSPALMINGSLSFEDFLGQFFVSAEDGEVAVLAQEGISFGSDEPYDYGVIIGETEYWEDEYYYTFVDGEGNPLSEVTVERQ